MEAWDFSVYRKMFAERGQHAGELPVMKSVAAQERKAQVLELKAEETEDTVDDIQLYADSTEPEEDEKPFLERIRQRFRQVNPNAAAAGAGGAIVTLMAANVMSFLAGGAFLIGLGCYVLGNYIPWKMS